MNLLTDKETALIETRLEKETDNQHKEKMIYAYAFYKACLLEVEKVLTTLKEYGLA